MFARSFALAGALAAAACTFGGSEGTGARTDASTVDAAPSADAARTEAERFDCAPLPAPSGTIISIADVAELETQLATQVDNTTLVLQPGFYGLSGTIDIFADGLTMRSSTGDPADVILSNDANQNGIADFSRMFDIQASDFTLAEMTLSRAPTPLLITGDASDTIDTSGALFYRLVIVDFEDRALEVTLSGAVTSHQGTLACSTIAGDTGNNCNSFTAAIDIRAPADGWRISENTLGPMCTQVFSTTGQLAIRVSRAARFTVVDHNTIDGFRDGLRVGDQSPIAPACNGVDGNGWDAYQTLICNNVMTYNEVAGDPDVGMDFFHACDAVAINNTIGWDGGPTQSVVFGGGGSLVSVANNAVSGAIDVPIGAPPLVDPNLFDLTPVAFTAFPDDMSLANVIGVPSADISGIANAERYCSWDRDGAPRDLTAPGFGAYAD